MIFSKRLLDDLEKKGRKVRRLDGAPLITAKPEPPRPDNTEKLLRTISDQLVTMAAKNPNIVIPKMDVPSVQMPDIPAPQITVNPTPVNIEIPARIKKWSFRLIKNSFGDTTEIEATAIE